MTAERILMGLMLGGIALGCGFVLYPFFSALLWAAILVFASWPLFRRLRQVGVPGPAAAGAMVFLIAVVVVLPIVLAVPGGTDDVQQLRGVVQAAFEAGLPTAPAWLTFLPLVGGRITEVWNSWANDLSAAVSFFRPYFGLAAEFGLRLLLDLANGVLRFLLALFIGFFFYLYGEALSGRLKTILRRIAGPRADRLILVTGLTVRGTVYGILGTAVVQGVLTALGLWLVHVPRAGLLGLVAGFLSVLPIGAPLVWIPATIWLLAAGRTGAGVILAIYGVVFISGADHLIRPYFIARGAHLPFLLTVLGVLGGALSFGLIGIFLGPVLLGIGFTLVSEFALDAEGRRPLV